MKGDGDDVDRMRVDYQIAVKNLARSHWKEILKLHTSLRGLRRLPVPSEGGCGDVEADRLWTSVSKRSSSGLGSLFRAGGILRDPLFGVVGITIRRFMVTQ